jgi:hypothetical protein
MSSSAQSLSIEISPSTDAARDMASVSVESLSPEKPAAAKAPAETKTSTDTAAHDVQQLARRGELFIAFGLIALVVVMFVVGRLYWDERYYVPEEGLGYWLGLVGGVMMLLAMVYGLVKHVPALRSLGWMKRWLWVHIFFGIAGPVLVLVHSTFHLGSLNGTVAMVAMLLVYLSGIMGRFLYSKIHYGLGGSKAQLGDMQASLVTAGKRIKSRRLDAFAESVMSHPGSLFNAWVHLMVFGWRSRWLTFQLRRDMNRRLKSMAEREGWSAMDLYRQRKAFRKQLRTYMFTLRKVALFSVYERFFAFWRHAHVPFLYLLLFSGIAHVIAVHMY